MKRAILLAGLLLAACGGGGGGDDSEVSVVPGTTPLDASRESTGHGTYRITALDYYESDGSSYHAQDYPGFYGILALDLITGTMTYKLTATDALGEEINTYDVVDMNTTPPQNYEKSWYQITGPYSIVLRWDNLCSNFTCANVTMSLTKISDALQPISIKREVLSSGEPQPQEFIFAAIEAAAHSLP